MLNVTSPLWHQPRAQKQVWCSLSILNIISSCHLYHIGYTAQDLRSIRLQCWRSIRPLQEKNSLAASASLPTRTRHEWRWEHEEPTNRCHCRAITVIDYWCADNNKIWRVERRNWRHSVGLDSRFQKTPMFTPPKKKRTVKPGDAFKNTAF